MKLLASLFALLMFTTTVQADSISKLQCSAGGWKTYNDARWRTLDYVIREVLKDGRVDGGYTVDTFNEKNIMVRSANMLFKTSYLWKGDHTYISVSKRVPNTNTYKLSYYIECHCDDYYQGYVDFCQSHQ